MASRTNVRVSYDSAEAFFENGRKVDEIVEQDTGRPVAQTKSLPPILLPVELTQDAIDGLKALNGVKVETIYDDE